MVKAQKEVVMFRIACSILLIVLFLNAASIDARQPRERYIDVTYTATIRDIPENAKRVEVWIPYPASDDWQRVTAVSVRSPYPTAKSYESEWGNAVLHLLVNGPEQSNFKIEVSFKVLRHEVLNEKFDESSITAFQGDYGPFQKALLPTRFAVIDSTITRIASEVTKEKETVLEKARAVYEYVLKNMDYNKEIPGWGFGDVQRICSAIDDGRPGTGNCTDFHSFFGSIMRASGIPVKFIMGYSLKPGQEMPEGKAGGYHCWAEFYLSGYGWIPVDISEADKNPDKENYYFGSICENRMKFSEGQDILLNPPQQGERLNNFGPDPYVEVDGIPYGKFERFIAYRNL
jgi:transglutaminase-like putative cysteine protease